jgi:TolB-like protein
VHSGDALGGVHARAGAPRRRIALGVAAGAALVVTGIALMSRDNRPPVVASAATIAVFPLIPPVSDTALTRLGRELVVTLSASLDGVGGIRTTDALTVLANARATDDSPRLADAVALAHRLGAKSVVYGSVMRVGNRVRIDVTLHSTSTTDPLARVTVTAVADDMTALTDSAAWGILRQLWQAGRPANAEPRRDHDAIDASVASVPERRTPHRERTLAGRGGRVPASDHAR